MDNDPVAIITNSPHVPIDEDDVYSLNEARTITLRFSPVNYGGRSFRLDSADEWTVGSISDIGLYGLPGEQIDERIEVDGNLNSAYAGAFMGQLHGKLVAHLTGFSAAERLSLWGALQRYGVRTAIRASRIGISGEETLFATEGAKPEDTLTLTSFFEGIVVDLRAQLSDAIENAGNLSSIRIVVTLPDFTA